MYNYPILGSGSMFGGGMIPHGWGLALALLLIWSLVWKGWALWLAARRHEKVWFIILLILNSAGILEIIYIFAVAKRKDTKKDKGAIVTSSTRSTVVHPRENPPA